VAVATDREYGLLIGGELAEPASVIVSTGARPINPFGL
jgi:hypothetical protein